ncbi:hypothetical protein SDC9_171020 [bioreactor metagenome]|uniref:Uncharacterized protein n=1 Tax=bioreactor metagenome TaxID=1076179 RepID=A0A645G9P1_9ZZZZ
MFIQQLRGRFQRTIGQAAVILDDQFQRPAENTARPIDLRAGNACSGDDLPAIHADQSRHRRHQTQT